MNMKEAIVALREYGARYGAAKESAEEAAPAAPRMKIPAAIPGRPDMRYSDVTQYDARLNFGKCRGKLLSEIAKVDAGYFFWLGAKESESPGFMTPEVRIAYEFVALASGR